MKRRDFITTTGLAVSAPMVLGKMNVAKASPIFEKLASVAGNEDKILVLIFLNGGNDGLNTLIPIDQYDELIHLRENVIVPQNQVIKLTDNIGLHPSLSGLKELYDDGKLHVLQSVGYPEPNFSHFRSTDIWTSGSDSDKVVNTGWLGRNLAVEHPEYPTNYPNEIYTDPLSISFGPFVSPTCQGPTLSMGMAINGTDIYNINSGGIDVLPDNPAGRELDYVRSIINQTQLYSGTIANAAEKGNTLSSRWPESQNNNSLSNQLKTVAQLISGGLKTRIYVCNINGFDTHSTQVETAGQVPGFHADLLTMVSSSIRAFQDEMRLHGLEDKVVGMTFSEFGRRIISNGSNGTDHGTSAPLFVFGKNVIPNIQGENPIIDRRFGVNDNLPMQYDFRSIYYSILKDWFDVSDENLEIVMMKEFQHLEIIKKSASSVKNSRNIITPTLSPNPAIVNTQLRFYLNQDGWTKVSLFDPRGQEILIIKNEFLRIGEHLMSINLSNLNSGNYYIRIQIGNGQKIVPLKIIK